MLERSVQIAGHDGGDHERLMSDRGEARESVGFANFDRSACGAPRCRVVAALPRDHGVPDVRSHLELRRSDPATDRANTSVALERRDVITPLPRQASTKRSEAAALQRI